VPAIRQWRSCFFCPKLPLALLAERRLCRRRSLASPIGWCQSLPSQITVHPCCLPVILAIAVACDFFWHAARFGVRQVDPWSLARERSTRVPGQVADAWPPRPTLRCSCACCFVRRRRARAAAATLGHGSRRRRLLTASQSLCVFASQLGHEFRNTAPTIVIIGDKTVRACRPILCHGQSPCLAAVGS